MMWNRGALAAVCIISVLLASSVDALMLFSASTNHDIIVSSGQRLVLPDVLRNGRDPGYDETTGTFTASDLGTYSFKVVLKVSPGCTLQLTLKKNNEPLASLSSNAVNQWDVARTTAYALLEPGDEVYGVFDWTVGTCTLGSPHASFFAGMERR